jgi:hypothetical protein
MGRGKAKGMRVEKWNMEDGKWKRRLRGVRGIKRREEEEV